MKYLPLTCFIDAEDLKWPMLAWVDLQDDANVEAALRRLTWTLAACLLRNRFSVPTGWTGASEFLWIATSTIPPNRYVGQPSRSLFRLFAQFEHPRSRHFNTFARHDHGLLKMRLD